MVRIVAASLFMVLVSTLNSIGQTVPQDFDSYVERVRKEFSVPGIAVTIVKDGSVILAKGYGVRTLGHPEPVDEKTLFGIASNSKAFTATALAMLVEEGKIEWDAPVTRYLPWFRLSNPYVTAELTVRDLLVHRSGLGLGGGDLLWWPATTYTRSEIARRLAFVPLATSFRSAYAYDNVLYLVAGELIREVSGNSWEDFVTERILRRLGMVSTTVRHSSAAAGGNVATPHARVDGIVRAVAPFASDNTNPAGGINSNAEEIARWMIVQLDSGRIAGDGRLFSPRSARALWSLVTPIGIGDAPKGFEEIQPRFNGYGLGFGVRDYRARKLLTHTGGLPGYVSRIAMIPELKLGVAVFTNQESGEAFDAITYALLDHYCGAADHDWCTLFKARAERNDSMTRWSEAKTLTVRDSMSRPSLPLARYAGRYRDAWYGDAVVTEKSGHLEIAMEPTPDLRGECVHWQYDTFLVRWTDRELRADAFLTFSLDAGGHVSEAHMKPASRAVDFSFDFQDLTLIPQRHEQ